MQDIADKLGLSKGTVSLVLSGKAKGSRVSEETCRKVKQMAAEMNYQPNEIARSLSTGKSMSIGVVITDISNEFFGNLTFHIQEQAKKYGYTVITSNTNESPEEFYDAVTTLLNKQVDGIILVPVDEGQEVLLKIMKRNLPVVQVDRYYPDIKANYIIIDNYKVSRDVIEVLIRKGLQRIAVVCYDINLNALTDRRQGYIDALDRHGLLDPALIKNINYENQEEEIKRAIIDLKNNPDKVDAIFFCSRRVFITGVKYMHREGIKIPEEMEVVCFDEIDSFSITNMPITYIKQPIRKMGEKAVDILMEQMSGIDEIKECVFEAEIEYSI
ncbi:DNA-binding transcriptional regulator [Proteiniphilum saccharofermentans]|uniref:DNA-binding transcriptional regulator n=2 Tax=Proteiniphilum TaxID=294702 RepID=A0A1R3SXM5_9BACT|nr:LacI family DNA-binding transcriptional regulator [Proteiniphilum saccharofermentans]SCD20996.1 DNA-binding transcriptional regulator [Proteiniphilum saccharofermentans]SFL45185.1 transcriptional regulator, LacI family [Porphyromonadaceae bacterium KH3CP3RA]